MSRDPLAGFADLMAPSSSDDAAPPAAEAEDFYPGSKKKRRAVTKQEPERGGWDDVPSMTLLVKGQEVTFYTVGVLAEALDRLPQTVRKWESKGYIPESKFRSPGRTKHGQKRLYTREMIEGVVEIAKDEGVVGNGSTRNVSMTQFPQRVKALFKEMKVLG